MHIEGRAESIPKVLMHGSGHVLERTRNELSFKRHICHQNNPVCTDLLHSLTIDSTDNLVSCIESYLNSGLFPIF